MVGSPFLYFLKISSRAGYAMRACWLAPKVLGRPLRLEYATTQPAAHSIPHPPPPGIVFVQPTDLFFRIHVFSVSDQDRIHLQAIPPAPRPSGGEQAGNCLTVTTGRIAAAWTNLLPLFAASSAPAGAGSCRLRIKCGVRCYRQRSGRLQGVRLTPLGVVLDGVSFLFAAGLPIRGRPTRKA